MLLYLQACNSSSLALDLCAVWSNLTIRVGEQHNRPGTRLSFQYSKCQTVLQLTLKLIPPHDGERGHSVQFTQWLRAHNVILLVCDHLVGEVSEALYCRQCGPSGTGSAW